MEANETTGSLKEIGKSDPLEIGSRIISGILWKTATALRL